MRRKVLMFALILAVVGTSIFAGPASAHRPGTGASRETDLSGTEVVPPPGDADGTGTAQLILYPAKEKFCYRLKVSDVGDVTAAHLHKGRAGENGPVVRNLIPPKEGYSRECVKRYGKRAVRQIANNLSNYYVDIHTTEYPDGAVRGQFASP